MAERREHWFWARNRTNSSSSKCFFKILMKGFQQRLALPSEFLLRSEVELSGIVSLKCSTDETWNIGLTRQNDEVFLEHGWRQFVEDNSLEEFHLLVFRYDGKNNAENSQFRVLVFDKIGCEKEGLDHVDIIDDLGDSSDDNVDFKVTSRGEKLSEGKHPVSATSRAKRNPRCNPTSRSGNDAQKTSYLPGETGTNKILTYNRYLKSHRRPVTIDEIAKAFRSALEVQSTKHHTFIKVMKASHVYKKFFLTIPHDFIESYFSKLPKSVILRVPPMAKTWTVEFSRSSRGAGLSRRWSSFVEDNNLEEGDACVFELNVGDHSKPSSSRTRGCAVGDVIFDVSIFRVVEETVRLSKVLVTL